MNYAKILFYNFLIIFFVNHLFPGIDIVKPTKIPHFGADLPFAVAVGLLNTLIYPICKLIHHRVSILRVALVAAVLNFVIYAILKVAPIGIRVTSIEGYLLAAAVVTLGSVALTYFYTRHTPRHYTHHHHSHETEHESHSVKPDDWNNPSS